MEFALFCEIPVALPWKEGGEYLALHESLEQAVLADRLGFHSVWTVEHHFLKDLSMCSAPEVLYGWLAARTERIRIGHGVRLLPHAYNNPVRVAEMAAMVDLISKGRLEFGVGRSATRVELEGFGLNPHETRAMQTEALDTVIRAWTEDELEYEGKYWQMPKRRVTPKPLQQPHPPVWWATTSERGHIEVGEMGLNLLSFTVGTPVDVLGERVAGYRDGLTRAKPVTRVLGNQVGVFTMVHCAPTNQEAKEIGASSIEWYVQKGGMLTSQTAAWLTEFGDNAGTYQYLKNAADAMARGAADPGNITGSGLSYDQLVDMGAVVSGDPDRCVEIAKRYADVGCELLLCIVNPQHIPHEKAMQTIELIGRHVIPELQTYKPSPNVI